MEKGKTVVTPHGYNNETLRWETRCIKRHNYSQKHDWIKIPDKKTLYLRDGVGK